MASKTRFPELGYEKQDSNLWRIIDMADGRNSAIGPIYKTKGELLGDLNRFASEYYGWDTSMKTDGPSMDEMLELEF